MSTTRPQDLSDEEVDRAPLDDLRAAYRSLRDRHVAETTALISRSDDITRRRDDLLETDRQALAEAQHLIDRADAIMSNDAETIDRLGSENARLAELLAGRGIATPDYLSDADLAAWMDRTGLTRVMLEGTYLGLVLDELRERRDAEAMFVDADLQLQRLASCDLCAADTHGPDDDHRAIVRRWRIAQGALCALARIHRGYLDRRHAVSDGPGPGKKSP